MGTLNLYLMKRAAINIGGLIVFACCVLLLERLLHIFEIISNSNDSAPDVARMVYNLLPHYLGIALPMALIVGTIITVDHFSKSSELTAALGAGVSLLRITKPFFLLAALLSVLTIFIEGYMKPVGEYNYQQIENSVKQRGFTAVLREGTFTSVGTRTFFAGTDLPNNEIGPIFIYESSEDGAGDQVGIRITTANQGRLLVREDANGKKTDDPILYLSSGRVHQIQNDKQIDGDLDFESSSIVGAATPITFRERGYDEGELTSLELFKNRNGTEFTTVTKETNNAALHFRAARTVLLLLLPFVAVPFGLNYGRNPSSAGIFIGVVFIVSLQKLLEFGQSLGASGIIPPWAGIWPTIGCVAIFTAYIFWRSAFKIGQPPLTSLAQLISDYQFKIKQSIQGFRMKLEGVESV